MAEIIASEGRWLTQKHLNKNETRGFWKRLYPAVSLTAADFEEWTDEQKEAYIPPEQEEQIPDAEALDIITGRAEQ